MVTRTHVSSMFYTGAWTQPLELGFFVMFVCLFVFQSGETNLFLSYPRREVKHSTQDPALPPTCASYLDDIETRTVLGPSSDADPNQVLGILL